ncbi:Coenzyme F420-reducing hydrogenase, delta subunit [Halobiforma haloterrestris]|uniref:Coenzyme F420-reducing hydrogenase, delta subunit n=1 Tax=Natronobacterium haloterrestre TaxID=148448 RepID=A0A1I1DLJ5_NATHA|nr:hydrogenase iron-sulfur subunit [Halobiforma haloterrestris]SFB73590.1 Coenzyme F420-reducing hydrogenase, delta subunit [Halobiforma haloterrestris]
MNVGSFVCSCADTCEVDLEAAREGIEGVDVAASSSLLCADGLPAMEEVIDEYDLDEVIVTCPEEGVQRKLERVAEAQGVHPDAVSFVDQREGAGWVHDEAGATAKTARMINARTAGLEAESIPRTITSDAGDSVAVVGDPETAAALADDADVTLIADGREYVDSGADLGDVTIERGRVVGVDGRFGEFTVRLESRVTEDCISCMKCVHDGPDGKVTRYPVDIDPDAPDGAWTDVCPTDAIEMDGVERTLEFDQIVYPAADRRTRGGRVGFYTAPIDPATISAVRKHLGGIEKPAHLDLEMDVCAAGDSSQMGCNECVEACPHDAVERSRIDEVEFHEDMCQNCGACTSSCPTGATRLREPSNERIAREVEALCRPTDEEGGWLLGRSESDVDAPIVAFVCSEEADDALTEYGRLSAAGKVDVEYPPILPVRVNCTDTVGEAHAMHALACGADGVAIVGCGGDCRHSGPEPKADLVDRLNRATRDLDLGERVAFFAPDAADPGAFVEAISTFAVELEPSPIPDGEHEATGGIETDPDRENPPFDSHGWTLESVRAILEHVDPDREVIRGLKDFGRMAVDDACTFTPTCSTICPTDAIRRDEDEAVLEFNHERCVNCGLCEEGCVEDAITMHDGLHLSLLPERSDGEPWTEVYEGEMRECLHCGEPFASEGTARKIEGEVGDRVAGLVPTASGSVFDYCDDCRAQLLYDRGEAGGESR